jgi:hypothetical protein
MTASEWRKSSFSQGGGTNCVEVAFAEAGAAVRDSKHVTGPRLSFPVEAWRAFVVERPAP